MMGLLMAASVTMADGAKVADRPLELDGLFGAKLGVALDEQVAATTNGLGFLSVGHTPARTFLSFTDYALFATPTTKKVFLIRAIAPSVPDESAALLVKTTVQLIEMRFGGTMTDEKGCRMLTFADGNFIRVARENGRVVIDAASSSLMADAAKEVEAAREACCDREMRSFVKDLASLQLVLKTQETGKSNVILSVCSVFGKAFGTPLGDSDRAKRLDDSSWNAQLVPAGGFVGCTAFEAFGSAMTKSVFRIRAVRDGVTGKADFARLRRAVEIAFKQPMEQKAGESDYCSLHVGNVLVTLSRQAERDRLVLEFTDKYVYVQHENELKSMPEKKFWQDIDAL